MKKLVTILLVFLSVAGYAQTRPLLFVTDTFKLYSNSNNGATLQIKSKTKDTIGFLYNLGDGITEFRRASRHIGPNQWVFGSDTLTISDVTISPSDNLDSFSFVNSIWCAYFKSGASTCFDLSKFIKNLGQNYDSSRILQYNGNGELLDSLWNNASIIDQGPGILISRTGPNRYKISATGVDGNVLLGGIVSHDTLYKYDVTSAIYNIGANLYNSAAGSTTLDPADPDNDRIDLILLDTLIGVSNKAGTASSNPQEPQINPLSQRILTRVIVKAGSTTPDVITRVIVYDQLTEVFTPSVSAAVASTNFTNTTNPYHLTRSADVPAWSSVGYMQFGGVNLNTYEIGLINFHIKLKAAMTSAGNIIVRFYNISTGVSSAITLGSAYGFDKSSTAYQNVTIPATALAFSGAKYTTIAFTFVGSGPGCYLDYIQLQTGISNGLAQYGQVYKRADSVFQNVFGSPVFIYKDSTGGSGGAGLQHIVAGTKLSNVNDSTLKLADSVWANLYARLSEKLKYTDSAAMLASYRSAIDAITIALLGKQATLVSGTNIKTVAGISLLGSGDIPASSIVKDSSNVTFYGAVPDGVTDCTAAIQLALNSHKYIYFPSGTYITSNLTINSGQRISGFDSTSVLQFKTGSTGFMLEAGGNAFTISNISLFGGNTSSYKNTSTSAANRSALHVNMLTNGTLIINNSIYGFDSTGIALSGASTPTYSPANITGNSFYNNFIAINTARDTSFPGEYCRINENSFHDNRTAIIKISGNTIFNSNVVVYNGYGVQLLQNNNGGHGTIESNAINHNTVYGIYARKITFGESIIGNQLFFNDIMIDSCNNVNIQGNTIAGFSDALPTLTITLRGGNTNYFKGNFTKGIILTRSNDNFIISDNYKETAGSFLSSNKDVIEYSGKVGIGLGATAPAYALDALESVNGASYIHLKNSNSGNSATAGIQLNNNSTDAAFFSLYGTGTSTPGTTFLSGTRSFVFLSDANTASGGTGKIQFATGGYNNVGSPNFTMHPNGGFGIGQVSPTEKLEVAGNVYLNTAGNKLKIATGTNASIGTATMVAGTVTVSTTAAVTGCKIFYSVRTPGGTQGFLSAPTANVVNGTSFRLDSSSASETSTVDWWIIN